MAPDPTPTQPDVAAGAETLIRRFEAAWTAGRRPAIDPLLEGRGGDERAALLVELVHAELELRLKAGEAVRVEEYLARYPELAAPAVLRELVEAEFRHRTPREPGAAAEYPRRFPQLSAVLNPPPVSAPVGGAVAPEAFHFSAASPPPPTTVRVPGYQLLHKLGEGGMGVVYKARQVSLNRIVALKMVLDGRDAGPEGLARFRGEAQALARLQHPHIVQVFEVGAHDGRPFFSLECVEGGSLDKKLTGAGVPPRQAAQMVETLARAVHAAHQAGVVHRDLKPANVLVGPQWLLKITDFGLAKRLGGDAGQGQTQTGQVMGTPCYMAPEQASDAKAVGPAADVYSLGAILYELLTGRPPFKGQNLMETLRQVLNQDPTPPRRLRPKTPADLETICLKCLEKTPAGRYAGAEALADDLRRFLDGKPVQARPVGRLGQAAKWARRNPVIAGAACAIVLAFLAAAGASTYFLSLKAGSDVAAGQADAAKFEAERLAALKKREAEEAEKRKNKIAADVALDRLRKGVALCRQSGPSEGLPLIADALEIAPTDPDHDHLRDVIRRNLGSWGQPVGHLLYPMKGARVALSPDGNTAIACPYHQPFESREGDKSVLLDVATGAMIADDLPAGGKRNAGRFSADGRFVVTGLKADQRWDARTGKPAGPPCPTPGGAYNTDGYGLTASAASADGGSTLSFGTDNRLHRWNLATGEAVGPPVTLPAGEAVFAANSDSPTLITYQLSDPKNVRLGGLGPPVSFGPGSLCFRRADGTTVGDPIPCPVDSFAVYSADGQAVLLAGYLGDGSGDVLKSTYVGVVGRVYDTATGRRSGPDLNLKLLPGGSGWSSDVIRAAQFRPDGRAVWVASDESHGWWDVATGKPIGDVQRFPEPVLSAAVSDDGRTILAGTLRGVRVWKADAEDKTAGSLVRQFDKGGYAAFSPDGKAVAVVERLEDAPAASYRAGMWDATTGEAIGEPVRPANCWQVFAPDARTFITLPRQPLNSLEFWDARRGGIGRFRLPESLLGQDLGQYRDGQIACSRDGRRWATLKTSVGDHPQLQVYETPADGPAPAGPDAPWLDARPIGPPIPLPASAKSAAVALSPDGKVVAAAGSKGVYLWSVDDGKPCGGPIFTTAPVQHVSFSGDGKSILGTYTPTSSEMSKQAGPTTTSRVWEVGTDPESLTSLEHGYVSRLQLSADGRMAVGTGGFGVELWDVATAVPIGRPLGAQYGQSAACTFTLDGRGILAAWRGYWDSYRSPHNPDGSFALEDTFFTGIQVRRLGVPEPLAGEPDRLKLWAEVVAGAEVDNTGVVHPLDAPTLAERKRRLKAMGGIPGQ